MRYINNRLSLMMLIAIFIGSLFWGIYRHIDGLGIFSINLAIIIFVYAYYKQCPRLRNGDDINGTNGNGQSDKNISFLHSIFTSEKFMNTIIILLSNTILSIIQKSQNKLTDSELDELKKTQQDLNSAANTPTPTKPKHVQ